MLELTQTPPYDFIRATWWCMWTVVSCISPTLLPDQEQDDISSSLTTQANRLPTLPTTPTNGATRIISATMKHVLVSTFKTELGALFHNIEDAEYICQTLIDIGYPQPPTHTHHHRQHMRRRYHKQYCEVKKIQSNQHAILLYLGSNKTGALCSLLASEYR